MGLFLTLFQNAELGGRVAYTILIVDDSETMRAVLTKTIHMAGIAISALFQAENGKIGLEILEREWIDIVFADINMPVMNGLEMVDAMVKSGQIHTTPVVIVSTEGSKVRVDELVSKGVKAFIRKPITPEVFRDVLFSILGKS